MNAVKVLLSESKCEEYFEANDVLNQLVWNKICNLACVKSVESVAEAAPLNIFLDCCESDKLLIIIQLFKDPLS